MVAETVMARRPNLFLLLPAAFAFRVAAAVAVAQQPSLLHQSRLHQRHSPHVTMSGSWPNADGTDGTDEWQEDSPPDLSVVPASAAHADQLASNAVLGEVEHLIADWQEAQALAGNDGVGDGAAAMMADWRRFLSDREAELRSSRKRELGPDAWVPAHLTGYFIDEKKGTFEDLEEEESAQARRNHVDVAEGFDDDADASFVFEWQLHAELEREKAASKHAPRSASAAAVGLTVKPEQGTLCIGIDLGTTNCAAAVVGANGRPYLIPMEGDAPVFPSIVAYVQQQQHKVGADANLYSAAAEGAAGAAGAAAKVPKNAKGTRASAPAVGALVGERARRQLVSNPHSTFSSMKRIIGRTATAAELRALAALDVPHRRAGSGQILLACPALGRTVSAIDVSAELVRKMLRDTEAHLGAPVSSAVVTVPAYFGESEREATRTACMLAGLRQVALLREPEAAALSYALGKRDDERVLVFDLGGGTFDVSIADVGGRAGALLLFFHV